MEIYKIAGTPKTPAILFDPAEGKLEISGRSIPENSAEFYKPILERLSQYAAAPRPSTVADFHMEYFNTSSSKFLLDVLKRLSAIRKAGKDVKVNWFYESDDRDIEESGEDYQNIVDLPFHFETREFK